MAARFALSTRCCPHIPSSRAAAAAGVTPVRRSVRCSGAEVGGGGPSRRRQQRDGKLPFRTISRGPVVLARAGPIDADEILDVTPVDDDIVEEVQRKRVRAHKDDKRTLMIIPSQTSAPPPPRPPQRLRGLFTIN